jgi:hypothetical protein
VPVNAGIAPMFAIFMKTQQNSRTNTLPLRLRKNLGK